MGGLIMTREKLEDLVWKHTHKDYKGIGEDGTRTVLHRSCTHGTCIVPLSSLTEIQLQQKLPAKVRERNFGPDPVEVGERISLFLRLATELGHLALKQRNAVECARCGASGALHDNHGLARLWGDGPIFTDACTNPTPTRR